MEPSIWIGDEEERDALMSGALCLFDMKRMQNRNQASDGGRF